MATRYAVASGNWSDTSTVWSDTDGGSPGNFVPVNNDTFVISAGVNVKMDSDQSLFANGMAGNNIIRGGATPGMLYFKTGSSGYLKIATGGTLQGTTDTNRGRLLANSDGVWGNTGAVAFTDKAIIECITTGKILATNLDIALHATHPSTKYIETYKNSATTYYTFNGSSDVDPSTNYITLGSTPPTGVCMLKPLAGGTLPAGLTTNEIYTPYSPSGNSITFVRRGTASAATIDITAVGSGTIALYTGYGASDITQTFDLFEDVSSDAAWTTLSGHNRVMLVDTYAGQDTQRGYLTSINGTTAVVSFTNASTNLDSAQIPGSRLYFLSRNVEIRSTATSSSTYVLDFGTSSSNTCIIDCGVINTASHADVSQTAGNGSAIYRHNGSFTVPGIISCFNTGIGTCTGAFEVSGIIIGASFSGIEACSGTFTVSGGIHGCNNNIGTVSGSFTLSGELSGAYYGIYNGTNFTVTATGIVRGCLYGVYLSSGNNIVLSGLFDYNGTGIYSSAPFYFDGISRSNSTGITSNGSAIINGLVVGNTTGVSGSGFFRVSGLLTGNATSIQSYASFTVTDCMIKDSSVGFLNCPSALIFNLSYENVTNLVDWSSPTTGTQGLIRAFNMNNESNHTRGWQPWGTLSGQQNTMTHELVTVPTGKSFSHKFTYTSSAIETRFDWEISRPTGTRIKIPVYAKHSITGLSETERLHWALIDRSSDPQVDPSNQYLDIFIASDSTEWQEYELNYTKVDDRPLLLRVWATRSFGNAYAYSEVIPPITLHRPLP